MAAPNPSKPDVGDMLMVVRELLRHPRLLGPIAPMLRLLLGAAAGSDGIATHS